MMSVVRDVRVQILVQWNLLGVVCVCDSVTLSELVQCIQSVVVVYCQQSLVVFFIRLFQPMSMSRLFSS